MDLFTRDAVTIPAWFDSGHPAKNGPGDETRQGRWQGGPKLLSHPVADQACSAFHRLESDIAGKPIRYYNVDLAGEDIVALDESNVVETRGLQ